MALPRFLQRGKGTAAVPQPDSRNVEQLAQAMAMIRDTPMGQSFMMDLLQRPPAWLVDQFPPGWPIAPTPLDPARRDTGMPEPRQYEYPVYWNIPNVEGQRIVPWELLRKAAEMPLFRACIEIRKNEIAGLDWEFGVSPRAAARVAQATGRSQQDVERDLRQKYDDDINRFTDFWEVPDRRNGREFASWIGLLLEEYLTWDAMAVYPARTFGGKINGFRIIDGSTIKPLLDEYGYRPEPPAPAYQQILYGFPRGEFTATTVDVDGELLVPGGMLASQLSYIRRVHRTRTPYGFSPTEQALLDGMLWNKRFDWMLKEYTQGIQPVQWLLNEDNDWDIRELLEYERILNDRMSGQTSERMRNPILPKGLKPDQFTQSPERYKPDYDLFLIKLVASHFDVTIAELGFTEAKGLGSSGFHEGQEDVLWRKATIPTTRWLQGIITRLAVNQMGMPDDLEFRFLGLDDEDDAAIDAVAEAQLKRGAITWNEERARLGLPAYDFKEADMPVVITQRGLLFPQGASDMAPPGVLLEPQSEMDPGGEAGAGAPAGGAKPAVKPTDNQAPIKPAISPSVNDVNKDIIAYRRWAKRHADDLGAEFKCDVLTLALAPDEMSRDTRVVFKAAEPGPKAPQRPGGSIARNTWSPYTR